MRHQNDTTLDDLTELSDTMVREPGSLEDNTAAMFHWYVDVPTLARRRSLSPVIPGELFWR